MAPGASRPGRPRLARVPRLVCVALLACVLRLAGPAAAQEKPVTPPAPERQGPGSVVEAVRAVDRLLEAFNAGDRDGVAASFAPHAAVWPYNWLVEGFRRAGAAAPDHFTWMLDAGPRWTYGLEVLERVVSGSFVFQRERLAFTGPGARAGEMARGVLYHVRDGRVQSVRQLPTEFDPGAVAEVERPSFPPGEGPRVYLDVAHFNHHKPELSYRPVVELLRRDGYRIRSWPTAFRRAALDSAGVDVLLIANATSEKNAEEEVGGWKLPTPSAFTPEEVTELEAWVREGGGLLLIADHLPWGGAAASLAAAFGAEFHNGFARDTAQAPPDLFRRGEGTLRPHPVTDGRTPEERVDAVATFVGQAFRPLESTAGPDLEPLLVFPESGVLFQPEAMREGLADAPRLGIGGWWQAAAGEHGSGRVALFGEAAMFRVLTAEGGLPTGAQNARLVRNTLRWLSRR